MGVGVETFMTLMKQFLSGGLPAEDFVMEYLALKRRYRDENEDLKLKLKEVEASLTRGLMPWEWITSEEYWQKYEAIAKELGRDRPIRTFSREECILFGELFLAMDAYDAPPETYGDLVIDEQQLREIVKKALDELVKLRSKENTSSNG